MIVDALHCGDMKQRTDYFRKMNQQTPIMPIRLPSPEHHELVKALAAEDGVTLSEWVRSLIGREVDARLSTAST